MDNNATTKEFEIVLRALLNQEKSKKQINSDIKSLEKVVNSLKLIGTFSKAETKKELNAYIKQLDGQLSILKLKAKIDSRKLKSEVNNAISNIKFKDIDLLNVDENKMKLKVRKVIADATATVQNSPISLSLNLGFKKEKLNNDLTTYLNKHTKIRESSVLLKEAEKVRDFIDAIHDKKTLQDATDAFQLYKSEVSSTGYAAVSTTDKIKGMLSHVSKIGSIFGMASLAVSQLKQSLTNLKNMDTMLTEISKANDRLSQLELAQIGNDSFRIASKYGKVATDYLSGVQEMSRAGYENADRMAELSTAAQGAGDMTAELANQYLIATDKAYQMNGSIEALTTTLDGANNICNNNAVNMSELAKGMSVVGSQAASSGMKVDETTAAIATMVAVTQKSGSEMATAFKGILMNLQQVTGEVDDSGDVIDTESLTKYEKACNELGVSLSTVKDGVVSLREPMQIIKELSEAYTKLDKSDAKRANLLSAVGGKYRANALNAILENYTLYEKILQNYADGIGSMEREAQKTAESWEGRLNSLRNSFDSLVNSLTNKNVIKGGISFFDNLIQASETLMDTMGEIPVLLTTINSSMVALNKDYGINQIFNKDSGKLDIQGSFMGVNITAIKDLKKHYEEAENAIEGWNRKLSQGQTDLNDFEESIVKNNAQLKAYLATTSKDAPASLAAYKSYLNAAGVSTDALRLKTILLSAAVSFGLGFAIQTTIGIVTTAIGKVDEFAHASEKCAERVEELMSSYDSALSKANSNAKTIESLADQYEVLSKGVNSLGQNLSLTTDEYSEYNDIVNQIADMFPNLVQGYTDEGNAILSLKGNVEQLRNAYKEAQQEAYNLLIIDSKDSDGNEIIKNWKNLNDTGFLSGLFDFSADSVEKAISKTEAVEQLKALVNMTAEEYRNLTRMVMSDFSEGKTWTDIEDKVGRSAYLQKTLGIDSFVSDEDFKNAKIQAKTLVQTYQAEMDSALKQVQTLANAYLMINEDYAKLEEESKNAASIIVNSINQGVVNGFEKKEDVGAYVANLLTILKENAEVQDAFVGLFTLDRETLQPDEAKEIVDQYLNYIAGILEENAEELKIRIGFEEVDELAAKYENARKEFEDGSYDLTKFFQDHSINTTEELDHWLEVTDGATSAAEAVEKYQKAKKLAAATDFKSFSEILTGNQESLDTYQSNVKTITDALSSLSTGALSASEQLDLLQSIMEIDPTFDIEMYKNADGTYDLEHALEALLSMITKRVANEMPALAGYIREIGTEAKDSAQGINDLSTAISNMESAEKLLQSVQDSMSENQGRIMPAILEDILSKYGEMEDAVAAYNAGLMTSQELYDELQKCYQTDWENFQITNQAKIYANETYYHATLENESDRVKELADSYGVDLKNFKSLAEAKAAIESKLLSTIGSAWSKYYDVVLGQNGVYQTVAKYNEDSYEAQNNSEFVAMMDKADELDRFYKQLADTFNIDAINFDDVKLDFRKSALSSSSSKETKENLKIFDWIDTQIQRTEEAIDQLEEKLNSLGDYQAKNIVIDDITTQYDSQLALLEKAKEEYLAYANAVGLAAKYQEKIQNGTFEIETFDENADKALLQQIETYQEWYEKAENVKEMIDEIQTSKKELNEQKVDNFLDDMKDKIDDFHTSMGYVSNYTSQNALADQILGLYEKELDSLEAMEQGYYELAEAVGLSAYYIDQIKTGTLDMESITDTTIRNKIVEYLEWYRKGEKVNQQIKEITYSMQELNAQKLDNLMNDFDRVTSLIGAYKDYYQTLIDVKEAKGLLASESDYNTLIQKDLDLQATLQEEYLRLEQQFRSSGLTPNDDEWYTYKKELVSLQTQMEDCTVSVEKFKDAILEIRWDNFEKGIEVLSNFEEEINDVSTLLGNGSTFKNGEITDIGITKLGLYAQQYVNAKQQIAEYNHAIEALGNMYKNGSYSLDQYNQKLAEFQSAQRDAALASNEARQAILEFNRQAIEAQIDSMKELIDAKKEALDAEKDLYEYQKSIAAKQATIQSLEKKIATLALSDAREDKALRLQLEEELAKEKEELADLQREHSIEEQKEALDKEYDNYEKEKKDELDELESNLDKQNEIIEQYLAKVRDNYDIVYDNIMAVSDEFGITFTDCLTSPWENATNAAELYAQAVGDVFAQLEIDSSRLQDLVGTSMGSTWAGESGKESNTQWVQDKNPNNDTYDQWWYKTSGTVNGDHTYSTGWKQIDDKWYNFGDDGWMRSNEWIQGQDGKQYYVKANGDMATNTYVKGTGANSDTYYWVNENGEWEPEWDTKNPDLQKYSVAYAKGTLSNPKSQKALTDEYGDELIIHAGKEGNVQYLTKGTSVIPADLTEKMLDMVYHPSNLFKEMPTIDPLSNLPIITRSEQPINVNVNTPLLHVEGGLDSTMLEKMQEMCNRIPNEIALNFKRCGLR